MDALTTRPAPAPAVASHPSTLTQAREDLTGARHFYRHTQRVAATIPHNPIPAVTPDILHQRVLNAYTDWRAARTRYAATPDGATDLHTQLHASLARGPISTLRSPDGTPIDDPTSLAQTLADGQALRDTLHGDTSLLPTLRTDHHGNPYRYGNLHLCSAPWIDRIRQRRNNTYLDTPTGWRPLRIGVDLDGVNYPFDTNYAAYRASTGIDPATMPPATHWRFYLDYGQTDTQFVATCHDAVNHGALFRTGEPYPGVINAWTRLVAAGHETHIVTDRGFGTGLASLHATIDWLDTNQFPYDTITIAVDKTVRDVDIFIEDKLENYDALTAAGTPCWLVNRPWNHIPGGDTRQRVTNVEEFANLVLNRAIRTR